MTYNKQGDDTGVPYGGINMIFSGDFAQLSPVFGSALYSGTVDTQLMSHMTVQGQKAAIGKALWHQVTTVVILRDNKLRTALENRDKLRALVLSHPALACFQLFCSTECSTECNYVSKGVEYSSIVYLLN